MIWFLVLLILFALNPPLALVALVVMAFGLILAHPIWTLRAVFVLLFLALLLQHPH